MSRFPHVLRGALAVLAGAAYGAAFPEPAAWWLALPAVATLFILLLEADVRRASWEGALFTSVAFALMLRWFIAPIVLFSDLGLSVALLALLACGFCFAALGAVFGWSVARWTRARGTVSALWMAPTLWTGWELSRLWFPVPFPWGGLAAAHATTALAAPMATVVGSAGLTWLLAALASSLAALCYRLPRGARHWLLWSPLALLLIVYALGCQLQRQLSPTATLRVAVLQGSVPREDSAVRQLETYERLAQQAVERGAELIIWPESAVDYELDLSAAYRARMQRTASTLGRPQIVGSLMRAGTLGWYNASVSIDPTAGVSIVAPKRQLVPFGEYIPARWLFGQIPALATTDDFVRGVRPTLMPIGRAQVAPLICYEAVFPGLAEQYARSGATLLINQTNDSWFGTTGGPRQHLIHGVLRAAETGRPLARAANNGISALIDRRGRIVAELPVDQADLLIADLELGGAIPPGGWVGQAITGACVTILLAALVAACWWRREERLACAAEAIITKS